MSSARVRLQSVVHKDHRQTSEQHGYAPEISAGRSGLLDHRLTVNLPDFHYEHISRRALAEGVSMGDVIRLLIYKDSLG